VWLAGRVAAAYLGQHTARAGLTIAMFGLVLCSLTVSSVLLAGAHRLYGHPDADNAGYDLRAQVGEESSREAPVDRVAESSALPDLRAALGNAPASRPEDFPAIGAVRSQPGELIRLGGPTAAWQGTRVSVLDAEFLRTTSTRLQARAAGYGDEGALWRALADRADLAVVGAPLAATLGLGSGPANGNGGLAPETVWLRARDGGRPLRLQVVGVLPARSPLGDGVFVGESAAAPAAMPPGRDVTYFLRARAGLAPERAAAALNVSFGDRGLRASVIDPDARLSRAVQAPVTFLLQGFLGVGLLSGVLAVGLLGARAVLERRAQIGLLRAVGMRSGAVQFSLLLEGSAVALAGAGVGLGVGMALALQVVGYLQRLSPGFPLVIPTDQLLTIAVLTWGASLLVAAVPAWRAGRVAPVEALRYE
jgi:putative ABC transport system permease protein